MAIQDAEAFVRPFRDVGLSGRHRRPISKTVFFDLLLVFDALAIATGALLAFLVSDAIGLGGHLPGRGGPHLVVPVAFGMLGLGLIRPQDFKRLSSLRHTIARASVGWSMAMFGLAALMLLSLIPPAVGPVFTWWGCGALGILLLRVGALRLVKQWTHEGRLARRVAVYGHAANMKPVVTWLSRQPAEETIVAGVFCDQQATGVDGLLEDLVAAARDGRFDQVMLAFPGGAEEKVREAVSVLRQLPVDVYWPLDLICGALSAKGAANLNGRLCLHIERKPLSDWLELAKWVEDKVLACLFLVAAAPVMGLISVAIKLDSPGPILFRQPRFGFNNTEIIVYKFRTMHSHLSDVSGATQTVKGDRRVTSIGRWLRRFNLDELPQLFNVLQGRLSIVGPRPHALYMKAADRLYHIAVDDYSARHRVKPGITGWAQVNGLRGPTDDLEKAERRVEYDLYYIENWSIWFDMRILGLTILRGFTDPNAI